MTRTTTRINDNRAYGIVKKLNEMIELGRSQNEMATLLGVSAATLSNLRAGNWADISGEMWNRIAAGVNYQEDWSIFETPNLRGILALCQTAQAQSRLLAVAGAPGMGKTTSLKTAFERLPNAFYLHVHSSMNKKDFLSELHRSLGINNKEGNIYQMTKAVADKLNGLDKPLLIIDDMGKLIERVIGLLQSIYDLTEGRCGIVLAGTDEMVNKLLILKKYNKKGGPEFFSRIGNKAEMQFLKAPSAAIIKQFCAAYNVAADETARLVKQVTDYRELRQEITNWLLIQRKTISTI